MDVSTYGTAVNGTPCGRELPLALLDAARETSAPRLSFAEVHFLFLQRAEAAMHAIASLWRRVEAHG